MTQRIAQVFNNFKNAQRHLDIRMDIIRNEMSLKQKQITLNNKQIVSILNSWKQIISLRKLLIYFSKCQINHLLQFNASIRPVTVTRVG